MELKLLEFSTLMIKGKVFLECVLDNQITDIKEKDFCRSHCVYCHEAYECFSSFKHLFIGKFVITEQIGHAEILIGTVVAANGLMKMYSTFGIACL